MKISEYTFTPTVLGDYAEFVYREGTDNFRIDVLNMRYFFNMGLPIVIPVFSRTALAVNDIAFKFIAREKMTFTEALLGAGFAGSYTGTHVWSLKVNGTAVATFTWNGSSSPVVAVTGSTTINATATVEVVCTTAPNTSLVNAGVTLRFLRFTDYVSY